LSVLFFFLSYLFDGGGAGLLDIVVGEWFVEWFMEWFVERFVRLSEVSLWLLLSKGFLLEWRSTGEGVTLIISGFVGLVLFFLGWTVECNVPLPAASEAGSTGSVVLFFCFGKGASDLSEVGWMLRPSSYLGVVRSLVVIF
jgi:hypothetical protein